MTRNTILTAVTILGLTMGTGTVRADHWEHVDDLAVSIQSGTRALYSEFRSHYRHTAAYGHLMNDTAQLNRLAAHIHEMVHVGASVRHLAADVAALDRVFHHIEGLVMDIERGAAHGFGGHVHGDTRHVRRLLNSIEDAIHHLQSDLAALSRANCPLGISAPSYQPAPYGHGVNYGTRNGGITFGGRGFSVRIGG